MNNPKTKVLLHKYMTLIQFVQIVANLGIYVNFVSTQNKHCSILLKSTNYQSHILMAPEEILKELREIKHLTMIQAKEWLSVSETALLLDRTENTIRKMVQKGPPRILKTIRRDNLLQKVGDQ